MYIYSLYIYRCIYIPDIYTYIYIGEEGKGLLSLSVFSIIYMYRCTYIYIHMYIHNIYYIYIYIGEEGVASCLGPSFRFPLFGGRGVGCVGGSRSGGGGPIHLSMANEERRKRPGTYAEKKKEKKERGGVQLFFFVTCFFFLERVLLQCRPAHVFMHVGEGRKLFFF
jgi:hypothetical protein